jgi:hypothetical protein
MTEPRRLALLIEIPSDKSGLGIAALRRFLKGLVRSYGIRCLSVLPPEQTKTFGSERHAPGAISSESTDCSPLAAPNASNAKPEALPRVSEKPAFPDNRPDG